MGQIPFVSEVARYLDGFLAAARPGSGCANPAPSPPVALDPTPAPSSEPPAGPDAELPASEVTKRRLHPLDSFPRLLDCVATNCPPDLDDQFRFRWFGLFYEAPGRDAFRLRLRLPGGRVQAFQFAGLADVTQRWAAGEVLLNAQGGLDIPGVPLRMATEVLRATEGLGLNARLTGGDCVQSVRGGEYDGWPDGHASGAYPFVCALEQALAHSRSLADLPNACEVIFLAAGEPVPDRRQDAPDLLVVRAIAPESPPRSGGADSGETANFLVSVLGGPDGGWQLPASQVAGGCLQLLAAWAADTDRTRGQSAGLADYCHALRNEKGGAVFPQAGWRTLPRLPTGRSAPPATAPRSGATVPGERLLSGQLRRIAELLLTQGEPEARLIQGRLHLAPGADSLLREGIDAALHVR